MNLIELVQSMPWAVMPDKLDEIHQVLYNHTAGIRPDAATVEALLKKRAEDTMIYGRVENGFAQGCEKEGHQNDRI